MKIKVKFGIALGILFLITIVLGVFIFSLTQGIKEITSEISVINSISNINLLLFLLIIMILLIGIGIGVIALNILNSIEELSESVEGISKGNFKIQISWDVLKRNDEIGRFALAFKRIIASMKLAILRVDLRKEEIGLENPEEKVDVESLKKSGLVKKSKEPVVEETKPISERVREVYIQELGPLGNNQFNKLESVEDKSIMKNLTNLKDKNIISEEEFEELKNKIGNIFNKKIITNMKEEVKKIYNQELGVMGEKQFARLRGNLNIGNIEDNIENLKAQGVLNHDEAIVFKEKIKKLFNAGEK